LHTCQRLIKEKPTGVNGLVAVVYSL